MYNPQSGFIAIGFENRDKVSDLKLTVGFNYHILLITYQDILICPFLNGFQICKCFFKFKISGEFLFLSDPGLEIKKNLPDC